LGDVSFLFKPFVPVLVFATKGGMKETVPSTARSRFLIVAILLPSSSQSIVQFLLLSFALHPEFQGIPAKVL
jgi:hypothetical protein